MRVTELVVLVVIGISLQASASPRSGGSSSGGGRLAAVSAGIGAAASGGSNNRGPGGVSASGARDWSTSCYNDQYRRRVYDGLCERRCPAGSIYRVNDGACVRRTVALVFVPDAGLEAEAQGTVPSRQGTASISGYLGAQKVFESDGAATLELAVADRWLRLSGSLTRFYERQPTGDALTLTMPTLALGVRIDDSTATRVYVEAGMASAMTKHDPMMMDATVTGALAGVYAEHSLSKDTTLIGSAKVMALQDNVRAASIRAGVRYHHVQASFSVLDFNVGPALFGPEIGVGF